MTNRFNEKNILDYLHSFDKRHIRQTKHSANKRKEREFPIEFIIKTLKEKHPLDIKQQENKKFALSYHINEKYNLLIVISLKDKFINIVTQYIYLKKKRKI